MTQNGIRLLSISLFILPLVGIAAYSPQTVRTIAATDDDAASVYKAKCAACHTPAATKFYDPAKPEAEQVEAILKGKKGEKPPYMPPFEAKGINEEQAKALVAYMQGLRQAPK
jgi:mono/diheme cytochrome c family protein